MKLKLITAAVVSTIALAGCNAEADKAQAKLELKTDEQKVSYVLGYNLANQFKQGGVAIDPAAFAQALKDVQGEAELALNEDEMGAVMMAFQQKMMAKQQEQQAKLAAEREAAAAANLEAGKAFLAENAKKEGVVTLESGLQYKVITEGKGPKPGTDAPVEVNYRGTLIDGTEFDSSARHGRPLQFRVNQVIAGWSEALKLMPEGSKWELYIPSDLAYGESGSGPVIGPNSTLIFEVELLKAAVEG